MQCIYTYIPETNYVPREYGVAAILLFLFMVLISLYYIIYYYYYYYYYYYTDFVLFVAESLNTETEMSLNVQKHTRPKCISQNDVNIRSEIPVHAM